MADHARRPEDETPIDVTLGEADFRRLCDGKRVRLVTLSDRPLTVRLGDIDVVAMLRAVLDGKHPQIRRYRKQEGS